MHTHLQGNGNRLSHPPRGAFGVLTLTAALFVPGAFPARSDAEDPRIAKQLEESLARYRSAGDWQKRRASLREGFLGGAKLWPLPEKTPLNPITHSRRAYADYSVENVALETLPGFYCTGNLYRPLGHKGPRPAVLCPHGHFKPLGRMREEQQLRCAHLARMGTVVFSYSMVGWQDSRQTTHEDPLCLALQTWNSIRALDFLCGLTDVDSKRIGITGASGGGTQTFFLTALDDRITASAPLVIVYPWSWFSSACNCETGMPVMRNPETNALELAAVAAPRPQLIISCGKLSADSKDKDPTHDFPKVGLPFIQEVYRRAGHPDRVRNLHLADEAHDFGPSKRKAVYAFFAEHLGLKRLEEDRDKLHVEAPEAMAVFDEKHPLPEKAAKTAKDVAA